MKDNLIADQVTELSREVLKVAEQLQKLQEHLANFNRNLDDYETHEVLRDLENLFGTLERGTSDITSVQDKVKDFIVAVRFLISADQSVPQICQLPHHTKARHYFYNGYTCKVNSDHTFCRKHKLTSCVLCGGDLI